jgi:2-polyprenyl-3-methyl-5-hydroxy-6-metoxy-1,4-benzoquinol methylase
VTICLPSEEELRQRFVQKYGDPATTGWSPGRRWRAGYFLPADVYETVIAGLVTPDTAWLDVGGGKAVFPENPRLSAELAGRCQSLTAVDPSDNVRSNPFAHHVVQSMLEDYQSTDACTLATLRMVVEHVERPVEFVRALSRVVRPGGTVVLLTVDRWSPVTLVSHALPFGLHHPIKRIFWGGEEEDTFPAHYLMNTRASLRAVFEANGFREAAFAKLDDLSVFGGRKWLNLLELFAWKCLRTVGLPYPERCVLAVYHRAVEMD